MKDYKTIRDFFFFQPEAGRAGGPSANPEIRKLAASGRGLKVTFVASHAGMVNANDVMYSPQGMKDSVHTWTFPQPRPWQIHHDDKADPIGRVIGARFVPFGSDKVKQEQKDALGLLQDAGSIKEMFEAIDFLDESGVLGDDTWRGVGELIVEAIITDSDAIEKILDGRYMGVSITQRPKQAFCSVCHKDWLSDGPCDHERGEVDEETKKRMFLVVGNTRYTEGSYVNHPADPFAQNTEIEQIGLDCENSKLKDLFGKLDKSMQTSVTFELVDSLDLYGEDSSMEKKSELDQQIETEQTSDQEETETEGEQETESQTKTDPPAETTVEEALRILFEDESNFTEEMAELLNEAMEGDLSDEEQDAKLSTQQRKNLPGSAFCGPNKSFPVNDCPHYSAALRLLGRYKGPGSRDKIRSCVMRKGKALGCKGASDSETTDTEETQDTTLCLDCLSDEELVQKHTEVEKLMIARKLKAEHKCDDCEIKDAKITEFEATVPDLQSTVSVLREEWQSVVFEHRASEESHAATLQDFNEILKDVAKKYLLMLDKDASEQDLDEKVAEMSIDELKKIVTETNISEIISFVRSGLSREPTETITPQDADAVISKLETEDTKYAEVLTKFQKRYGRDMAQKYLNELISRGKVSQDYTLAKALETMAK